MRVGLCEFEVKNNIGIIHLTNQKQNLIDEPEFTDADFIKQWVDREHLKGVVITGRGRHFSGGANLQSIWRLTGEPIKLSSGLDKGKQLLETLENLPVPTVAAINGTCLGAGLEISLACTFRFSVPNAIIGFPEAGWGLIPGLAGVNRTLDHLDKATALKMILRAELLRAEDALALKLIHKIVPKNEIIDYCIQFIEKIIADRPIEVIRAITNSINNHKKLPTDEALRYDTMTFVALALKAQKQMVAN